MVISGDANETIATTATSATNPASDLPSSYQAKNGQLIVTQLNHRL
jgi:hypothetical protein